ncbi:hypothetical protein MMC30_009194 [Trapelia coarctata]|nr:hypothetical protein [Trapelia coarctata]
MNFTVTSRGRQFDRLALMYLGDVEVFRTSTAEPTVNGIVWTYVKEMQQYDALWKVNQKILFDLGNLVDSTYTGIYNTSLTAIFFTIPDSPPTADEILPISAMQSAHNQGSVFSVPGQNASVSYTLPQNVNRAVVSLQACGQGTEEFWYTNTFTSEENTFAATTGALYGGSPWREVQLLIDGQLAGVSWPFPVIFTGGIVPGLWRPIVGIDAFDLREHEIDISPFLPVLLDGNPHSFEIRVASLGDDGSGQATLVETPGSYWLVSGKIFLFLDTAGHVTTGSKPTIEAPVPSFTLSSTVTQNAAGENETLTYSLSVSRQLSITSTIHTSSGSQAVSWIQDLTYSNFNALTAQGLTQTTTQSTKGSDHSSSGYLNTYNYPISVTSSYSVSSSGALSINGSLSHGLDFNVYGPSIMPSGIQTFNITSPSIFSIAGKPVPQEIQLPNNIPVFSGALLSTTQTGDAVYYSSKNGSYSYGTTEQDFVFQGAQVGNGVGYELYSRHVKAVNASVVEDEERLAGRSFGVGTGNPGLGVELQSGLGDSVRAILGRGPGGLRGGGGEWEGGEVGRAGDGDAWDGKLRN